MAGVIVGLEMAEAASAARLFGAQDELLALELLGSFEAGALAGVAKQLPKAE